MGGGMVFVHPWQYRLAMRAKAPEITSFAIIFSESFEYLIEESLQAVGKGAWTKSRFSLEIKADTVATASISDLEDRMLEVGGSLASDDTWNLVVKRTFLQRVPAFADAHTVCQSTTEVHSNAGPNP